jgi:hypothetical protein
MACHLLLAPQAMPSACRQPCWSCCSPTMRCDALNLPATSAIAMLQATKPHIGH